MRNIIRKSIRKSNKRRNKNPKKIKSKRSRRIRHKFYGGNLPDFISKMKPDTLKPETLGLFAEVDVLTQEPISRPALLDNDKISKSLNVYQEWSMYINGFLRYGFDYLLEYNLDSIFNSEKLRGLFNPIDEEDEEIAQTEDRTLEIIDELEFAQKLSKKQIKYVESGLNIFLKYGSKNILKYVYNIDQAFMSEATTVFDKKTILFRGTEDHNYKESSTVPQNITASFTSTSKSLDSVLEFINKEDRCCLNILIVDAGVPYLDMELNQDYWKHQREVLLPRGLNMELIDETEYMFDDSGFYKTYIYHVTMVEPGKYSVPAPNPALDINQAEFYEYARFAPLFQKVPRLLDLILKILKNKSLENAAVSIDNIKDLILRYYNTGIQYKIPKTKYNALKEEVWKELNAFFDLQIQTNNIKPNDGEIIKEMITKLETETTI
jgi:hypothetical protein